MDSERLTGFPEDWFIFRTSRCSTPNSNHDALRLPKGQSQSGTCRDLHTGSNLHGSRRHQCNNSEIRTAARAGDTNGPPAQHYLQAVFREMSPSRRGRRRPMRPVDAETSSPALPRSGVRLGVETLRTSDSKGSSHVGPLEGCLQARNLQGPSGVGRPSPEGPLSRI